MITLEAVRRILGPKNNLSDGELELLRDQFYALADITVTTLLQGIYLILFTPFDFLTVEDFALVCVVETGVGGGK